MAKWISGMKEYRKEGKKHTHVTNVLYTYADQYPDRYQLQSDQYPDQLAKSEALRSECSQLELSFSIIR